MYFISRRGGLPTGVLCHWHQSVYLWTGLRMLCLGKSTTLWLTYVDDMFVIRQHVRDKLDHFINSLNGECTNMKFTMRVEQNKKLQFLNQLTDWNQTLICSRSVYRKPIHT